MPLRLPSFLSPSPSGAQAGAKALYASLVAQARQPFLYSEYRIPDTLDGRFDAIVLHLFLVTCRLRQLRPDHPLATLLLDAFIADMDRSLREMGVGDMGVGKRVKRMASALLGRMRIYEKVMRDETLLAEALARNVYRASDAVPEAAMRLARYVRGSLELLAEQPQGDIESGKWAFAR